MCYVDATFYPAKYNVSLTMAYMSTWLLKLLHCAPPHPVAGNVRHNEGNNNNNNKEHNKNHNKNYNDNNNNSCKLAI